MNVDARPRVTVCVATYNQAPYIERCVASVLEQAGEFELEVLVGDDGSKDNTGDVLEALLARTPGAFTLVRRPANIGGTQNYQNIVARASGDFIAHLDGDDAWLPGKLDAQLRFLVAHPQCPAVYCNAKVVDNSGRTIASFTNTQPPLIDLAHLAAKGNFLMHSSLVYRARHRDAFLALAPPVIDWRIHLALACLGPLGFINEPLALYRHATETSTVRNAFPWVQRLLWEALRDVLAELPPEERTRAVAHFAAGIVLAGLRGKAGGAGSLLDEAALAVGLSRNALIARSAPAAAAIVAHQVSRKFAALTARPSHVALHARI